jgi:hypothetical protein
VDATPASRPEQDPDAPGRHRDQLQRPQPPAARDRRRISHRWIPPLTSRRLFGSHGNASVTKSAGFARPFGRLDQQQELKIASLFIGEYGGMGTLRLRTRQADEPMGNQPSSWAGARAAPATSARPQARSPARWHQPQVRHPAGSRAEQCGLPADGSPAHPTAGRRPLAMEPAACSRRTI